MTLKPSANHSAHCPVSTAWRIFNANRWRFAGLVMLFHAAAATGCGDATNTLGGSIGEELSLDFDEVRIYEQDIWLIIDYTKRLSPGGNAVTCRLVVDIGAIDLRPGLQLEGKEFTEHVTLIRLVESEAFPDIAGGQLVFDSADVRPGGTVAGGFEITFVDSRALRGEFEASVDAGAR